MKNTVASVSHPPIASESEWRARRKELLAREKEATRLRDKVAAERRRLPMVEIVKDYVFEGKSGKVHLGDIFEGKRQLIVYHFMFDPKWDKGCPGCTGFVNALGDLSLLGERDTSFALISRAPFAKLEAFREKQGWNRAWYSSFESDFNYDFHVTLDEAVRPIEYNFRTKAELMEHDPNQDPKGEAHGASVFFQLDGKIHHTYSTYARGAENLTDSYNLLDLTPYGRQEDWEDSPAGVPQRPTYG